MFEIKNNQKIVESDVKEWFIIIENQQAGPFSLLELKANSHFTPDTLVWKKGFKEWIKARFVPELQQLFKDEIEPRALHEPEEGLESDLGQQSQATLTLQQDPYQFILWILLLLLLIFYTFYQFYYKF